MATLPGLSVPTTIKDLPGTAFKKIAQGLDLKSRADLRRAFLAANTSTISPYEQMFNAHIKSLIHPSDENLQTAQIIKQLIYFMKTTGAGIAGSSVIRSILRVRTLVGIQSPFSINSANEIEKMLAYKTDIDIWVPFPEQVIPKMYEVFKSGTYKATSRYLLKKRDITPHDMDETTICRYVDPSEFLDTMLATTWLKTLVYQHFHRCDGYPSWRYVNGGGIISLDIKNPQNVEEYKRLSDYVLIIATLVVNGIRLQFMLLKPGKTREDVVKSFDFIGLQFLLSTDKLAEKIGKATKLTHADFIKDLDVSQDKTASTCLASGEIKISRIALDIQTTYEWLRSYNRIFKYTVQYGWTISQETLKGIEDQFLKSLLVWSEIRQNGFLQIINDLDIPGENLFGGGKHKKIIQLPLTELSYKLINRPIHLLKEEELNLVKKMTPTIYVKLVEKKLKGIVEKFIKIAKDCGSTSTFVVSIIINKYKPNVVVLQTAYDAKKKGGKSKKTKPSV